MPNKIFTEATSKSTILNSSLLKKQGIDVVDVFKIERLHEIRKIVVDIIDNIDDVEKIRYFAKIITQIDFQLQKLWKFPLNINYHRWFELSKCSCPKYDNVEYIGTGYRIINPSCILHGKK